MIFGLFRACLLPFAELLKHFDKFLIFGPFLLIIGKFCSTTHRVGLVRFEYVMVGFPVSVVFIVLRLAQFSFPKERIRLFQLKLQFFRALYLIRRLHSTRFVSNALFPLQSHWAFITGGFVLFEDCVVLLVGVMLTFLNRLNHLFVLNRFQSALGTSAATKGLVFRRIGRHADVASAYLGTAGKILFTLEGE